ncbi:lysozyme inhibitor LprI family protein [Nitratifractor salsuginis]|uniref:Lysozyme inhibitor LprI N-terminal domain-containing protein n=1 Tax=Nitratifractor salsuginis (strain DSM 16511 / JCM 12458 / E9I37-1) TaxID=749222 RepID=E6WXT8_NITSE|nr:hypothetical protein [Nitratifractor salsuginis]ADV46345.1 hypothetical protein Nitsa_1089 [Nitratifractor salsuginis DSM 16511]
MKIFPRFIAGVFLSTALWAMPSDYCPQPPWCSTDWSLLSPGERTVCSDEILSIEDNLLSSIYRHLQFYPSIDVDALRLEEKAWLRRRNRIADRDELMLFYLERIRVLAERLARARRMR